MALAGKPYTEIGKCWGSCTETITNLMNKYQNYRAVSDLPGEGPRKVTERTKRWIIRYLTLDQIASGLGRYQLHWENPAELKLGNFEGEKLHFGTFGSRSSEFLGRTPHAAVLHARQRKTARCQDQSGMVQIRNFSLIEWPLFSPQFEPN